MKPNFRSISLHPTPVRVAIFVATLLVLWLPLALPIYWIGGTNTNWVSILTMLLLYLIFLVLTQLWGKYIYSNSNLLKHYGLIFSHRNLKELLQGIVMGGGVCLLIFMIQGLFGWLIWQSFSPSLITTIIEGLVVAIAVGCAEELVFRGWLLEELERDYSPSVSLWVTAIIFGLLHFIKPLAEIWRTLPQLPALIFLGLILVWAKRQHQQRLGMSIGIHSGLIWGYYLIDVGDLVNYTQLVSDWVTGIDSNPLAGLMGWLGLLGLGVWVRVKNLKLRI